MSRHPEYIIPFSSYSPGSHEFEFEVTDRFFEDFPEGGLSEADLKIWVTMIREEQVLEFVIRIGGTVSLACDRCLEDYTQRLDASYRLFARHRRGPTEDEPDVLWILHGEHQVNLAQHFYEYIMLSLPMKHVHPDREDGSEGCNPEMLALLKNYSVGNDDE